MKIYLLIAAFCISVSSVAQQVNIIPRPASVELKQGTFTITPATYFITTGSGMENAVNFLNNYLQTYYGFQLKKEVKPRLLNVIILNYERMDNSLPGAYRMDITKDNIEINADNEQGIFYAVQSLIQLLPVEKKQSLAVPQLSIVDSPRFAWRGMHLDVSRHFFPVSYIKKYIDYIAMHKMNYFHWHLTDDQGWRIEIKKYPRLTEVGAWRDGTIIGRYPGTGNDHIKYGGYYTQEEIKDVVQYAKARYVTIIPEIEMPGHSMAALAAYPQLGTTPDSGYSVAQTWGINDKYNNVLNPSEYTFKFYENVLDEVMPLFPASYIHIGGDECSKIWWHASAFCQQLMKEKGIKDEHGLQSYFIQRIEKYVNGKGKQIIGWDEILEGGLAPNATVMSWRGEQGGIDAARQNHHVIMTPGNPVYFDHSQSLNEDSVTIGGYNSVEKVYAYEPVPKELNEAQARLVLGAQGNVWTEYIGNTRKLEYMVFPRMTALSEALWSPKEKRNWSDFQKRLIVQFARYDLWNTNYSRAYFDIKGTVSPTENNDGVYWHLESTVKENALLFRDQADSYYLVNPLKIIARPGDSITLTGIQCKAIVSNGEKIADYKNPVSTVTQQFFFNKATGKKIKLAHEASANYPGDGAFTLVNGIINQKGFAKSTEFLGFNTSDCEAVIDLGVPQTVSNVTVNTLRSVSSWIWRPQTSEAFVSDDGINFRSVRLTDDFNEIPNGSGKGKMVLDFDPLKTRYIKVIVKNWGLIPAGNPGAGKESWLFVDEIEVN